MKLTSQKHPLNHLEITNKTLDTKAKQNPKQQPNQKQNPKHKQPTTHKNKKTQHENDNTILVTGFRVYTHKCFHILRLSGLGWHGKA